MSPTVPNETQRLRDRVEELERLLGCGVDADRRYEALGLRPTPRRVLGFIVARPIATREGLFAAIYGGRPESDQPEIKVLDQHVWRVRNALASHGIKINMHFGVGYSMDAADKAKLNELVRQLLAE